MASEAEVDLLISTAGALPELERDLSRIVRQAENDADAIDLDVAINARQAAQALGDELDNVIRVAEGNIDGIEVGVLIEQRDAVRELTGQLTDVIQDVQRGQGISNPLSVQAVLDGPNSIRRIGSELQQVVANIQATAPEIEIETVVDRDSVRRVPDLTNSLTALGRTARTTAQSMAALTGGVAALSVGVGSLVPLLASVAGALQQIAPAAAVTTQAMLAQQLVAGTLKLAMIGVADATELALDPDAKPEELQKSLEKLAPEARKFVTALQGVRSELRNVQQGVQNRVFQDLDESLASLGQVTAPLVTSALNRTADSLNRMAKGVVEAANGLSSSGILGTALDGATQGLTNLEAVPGRLAIAFGTLAAGAAPAFDRITQGIDTLTARIQEKLLRSLADGSLERAINAAVDTFSQLFDIVGNFAEGFGNIFSGLTESGGGLFDVLEKISEAFVKLTASKEFQEILQALTETANVLVETALPLIEEAFIALAPVIQELALFVQELIRELGPQLIPVIQELAPVLLDLVIIAREQLPFALKVTGAALEALAIVLGLLHSLLQNVIIPIVREVADALDIDLKQKVIDTVHNIQAAIPLVGQVFEDMKQTVITSVTSTALRVVQSGLDLKDRFVRAMAQLVDDAINEFERLPGRVLNALAGLIGDMTGLGRDAVLGFAAGLASGVGEILSIARNIADSVTSTIAGALDSHSPSRKTRKEGQNAGKGLALGIKDTKEEVRRAAEALAGEVVKGASVTLTEPIAAQVRKVAQEFGSAIGDVLNPGSINVLEPIRALLGVVRDQIGKAVGEILNQGTIDISEPISQFFDGLKEQFGRAVSDSLALGRIDAAPEITRPPGSQTPVFPTFQGEGTSVVNVFIGNELVDQHIDNRLRRAQGAQDRRISQGIRI